MIQVGDTVIFRVLPPWVDGLPEESRRIFNFCFGRAYRVAEIDSNGLVVLDISKDVDHRFGGFMNDLRVEAEYLEKMVSLKARPTNRSSGRVPGSGRRR